MKSKSARISKPRATKTTSALVKSSKKEALLAANKAELEGLAKEIRASHESIGLLAKSAKEKMAETMVEVTRCGKLLSECKALVPHGEWINWIKDNCKMSVDTAQVYMRVAPRKSGDGYLEEPRSIRQAIALLSNGTGKPRRGKGRTPSEADGASDIKHVVALANKLSAALRALAREHRNDAFEALEDVRNWINSASIPV